MLFSVIAPAPALSESALQEALAAGPPFVDVDGDYDHLLDQSGWRVVERIDVTGQHLQSLQILVRNMDVGADELTVALGADELAAQKQRREFQISAVERGLLKREVFLTQAD